MSRVSRWECDQCGAHITGKERLYRVKLEEPTAVTSATFTLHCRKKDMCHACFDKVLFFLKREDLDEEEEK